VSRTSSRHHAARAGRHGIADARLGHLRFNSPAGRKLAQSNAFISVQRDVAKKHQRSSISRGQSSAAAATYQLSGAPNSSAIRRMLAGRPGTFKQVRGDQ
jgi:hypothetical protein